METLSNLKKALIRSDTHPSTLIRTIGQLVDSSSLGGGGGGYGCGVGRDGGALTTGESDFGGDVIGAACGGGATTL